MQDFDIWFEEIFEFHFQPLSHLTEFPVPEGDKMSFVRTYMAFFVQATVSHGWVMVNVLLFVTAARVL